MYILVYTIVYTISIIGNWIDFDDCRIKNFKYCKYWIFLKLLWDIKIKESILEIKRMILTLKMWALKIERKNSFYSILNYVNIIILI